MTNVHYGVVEEGKEKKEKPRESAVERERGRKEGQRRDERGRKAGERKRERERPTESLCCMLSRREANAMLLPQAPCSFLYNV